MLVRTVHGSFISLVYYCGLIFTHTKTSILSKTVKNDSAFAGNTGKQGFTSYINTQRKYEETYEKIGDEIEDLRPGKGRKRA